MTDEEFRALLPNLAACIKVRETDMQEFRAVQGIAVMRRLSLVPMPVTP